MATFTHKGQALIADLMAQGKALNIDQVIFANIPELDPSAEVDQHSGKPAADLIVHESGIYRASFVNQDSVVYSAFLDSTLGFTFNWFGLYCTEHETLIALEYTEPQNKVKTENGIYGNNLTKNFVIKFSGAKTLANIEIPAESWQLNFADQVDELYQRTEQASEQRLGIISVATLEEIRAGDSAIKAITPKHLKPILEEFNSHAHTKSDIGLSELQNFPLIHDASASHKDQYASGAAAKQAYDKGQAGLTEALQIREDLETFVPKRAMRSDFSNEADNAKYAETSSSTLQARSATHAQQAHNANHLGGTSLAVLQASIQEQKFTRVYHSVTGTNYVSLPHSSHGAAFVYLVITLEGVLDGNSKSYSDWIVCPAQAHIHYGLMQCFSSANAKLYLYNKHLMLTSTDTNRKIFSVYTQRLP